MCTLVDVHASRCAPRAYVVDSVNVIETCPDPSVRSSSRQGRLCCTAHVKTATLTLASMLDAQQGTSVVVAGEAPCIQHHSDDEP